MKHAIKILVNSLTSSTRRQAQETGIVLSLAFLVAGYFFKNDGALLTGIVILTINILWCDVYRPLAKLWFKLSELLGVVTSRVLLLVVYLILVLPVGTAMKLIGYDPMKRRQWKKDQSSVFEVRGSKYQGEDLSKPY